MRNAAPIQLRQQLVIRLLVGAGSQTLEGLSQLSLGDEAVVI